MSFTRSIAATVLAIACLGTAARSAEPAFRVHDGFGFDWLAPDSARCTRVATKDTKAFQTCAFHDSGAFGLSLAYFSCPIRKGSELLVFKSSSECQEALETMQANAP